MMDSKPSTSKKRKPKIEPELLYPSQISNPLVEYLKKHSFARTRTSHLPKYAPDPERRQRFSRSYMASKFTDCCTLVKGGKICISSSEFEAFVPPTAECCFDSSWVAVHGIHSICAVTFRKPLDLSNPSASFRLYPTETKNMELFSQAVISQVEFSLVVDTEKSWDEAKDPVSNFLYQRMRNSGLAFTDHETIQTAIGAFQHMCRGQELSAKDIWVTSMDVASGRFDHLDIEMIAEQLVIVNNGNLSPTKSSLL